MQAQSIVAEQTSRNRYVQAPSHLEREIELTVRLEIPEAEGVDVGIDASFDLPVPPELGNALAQRLYQGVHGGVATVGAPLPEGGIGVHITRLHVTPPLGQESATEEVRRVGDILEALVASTVAALWAGVISLGVPSAP